MPRKDVKRFKAYETEKIVRALLECNEVLIESGLGEIYVGAFCTENWFGKPRACQGSVSVKLPDGRTLRGVMKRGILEWYLGDLLDGNDVPSFVKVLNLPLSLTKMLKPILDRATPPDVPEDRWEVSFTLLRSDLTLPEWVKDTSHEATTILLPRTFIR